MEHLGSHWADFREIIYFGIFFKIFKENSGFIKTSEEKGYFT